MATTKLLAAAITSLITTEANSLANNAACIATSGYDNGTNLYIYGLFELNVTFAVAPTANSLVELYLIPAPDGTNYDDGSATGPITPVTTFVGGFPLRAVTTAQKVPLGVSGAPFLIPLPPVPFKAMLYNKSGQAFPASGSTLKMVAYAFTTV